MKLKRLIYILCGCTAALVVAAAVCLPFSTAIKGTPENEKYIVCFNTQGGNAIEKIEVDANGKIQQPADPILEGYVFKGWYKDAACTELFDFEKDTIGANTYLYAKWEPATTLEVHFNAMGGSTVQNVTASRDGLLARPKDPEKLDFIFAGWYQNAECSVGQEWNFDSDLVTSPMTLYAKWVAITGYKVHFNTMGGNSITDIDAPKGGTISAPTTPTKAGYTFAGWYQDEDCSDGQEWNFDTDKVSSNMILYAKWTSNGTIDTYTVTFVTNSDSVIDPIKNVESGSKIKEPVKPTKEGYTFIAWHLDKDCLDEPWDFNKDIVEDNTILYAEWSSATYKISYVTEYGVKPTSTNGSKLPSELAILTERGHVFCGWYLDAEFKTKATAGATIEDDTTLYAKWRDKTKYDELLEEKDYVLVNDDFDNYSATDRLSKFESWIGSEPGIYYDTHVGSSSTVQPSDTTTYIQMENGVANLKDTSNGASVQLVLNSGEITSGIIEGYFEVTLKDSGNSWTFFQLYGKATNGKDADKVDELFGLRVNGGNIKYRVNGGTAKDALITIACSDKTYKVYFTIDMEAQSLSLTINDGGTEFKNYLTDLKEIQFTSVNGFKFTSSDNGSKTLSADYLIMNNMNLSLAEYQARMKKQAQDDYDALDIANQYPSSQTALSAILSAALDNIDSKKSISEVKKAYADYLVELDNAILSAQKQKLANELDHYVDASFYTNEKLNKKALTEAIATGKANILKATTYNQAINALNEAKQVIDEIPTDSELLGVYQATAIAELKGYKDINNYTQNVTAFRNAITAGETAINAAKTIDEVDAALAAAKEALDAIDDDNKLLQSIKASLCKELDDKVASIKANELADSKYASYVAQIEEELTSGKSKINKAETKTLADAAKAEAVKKIELVLSAALKTIEEFKEDAINTLNAYAQSAGTGYDDTYLLNNIDTARQNGVTAINAVTGTDAAAKDKVLEELEAAMRAIDACIEEYTNGVEDAIVKQGQIVLSHYSGVYESAVLEWKALSGATDYKIYVKGGDYSDFTLADDKICYISTDSDGYRADLIGLESGVYNFKVVPVIDSAENEEASTICKTSVVAYDRSGFAHFNNTEGVGAYNDNGTLKDNAIVLYVTDENKNTIQLTYGNLTVTGIGNILNSAGQDCGEAGHEGQCKRVSGGKTTYGTANTNAGILAKLAEANIPLVVRFVGCVSNSGKYKADAFDATQTPLIDGITVYSAKSSTNCDYGAIPGDNGHMARIKSGKNITLEGVGSGAVIDGWGFHFICESAHPDYGKNFEVRNLAFINQPEDAIGMEGVQEGGKITASVERCWIHHNEFYSPNILNPTESDKSEGDGSCDFKRGQFFTCSYNYFEGCHKTNLVGSADSSLQFNLTYHHNYWKNCQARGPLARQANIHMYNNVFEGQTDYAMNTRANAFIYSEYNLFYTCKNPQRVDGGAIKSYNDSFSSTIEGIGTVVSDKNTPVSNSCAYGSIDYSQFELNSELSYIPTKDYYLQESITEARKVIYAQVGTSKDTYINPKDVTLSDLSYLQSGVTPVAVNTYPTTLNPGKISKTVYAFKIDRMAEVTLDTGDGGVLVNEAGECFIDGDGVAVLEPGTYMVQAKNFSPGKNGASASFKDMTINSISFEEYNSAEFDAELLANYNRLAGNIPANITYNNSCYTAIKSAMNAYNALRDELKSQVSVPYSVVDDARLAYVSAGETYVENLISAIGTVDENSGSKIAAARKAYNDLHSKVSYMSISNYSVLLAAEDAYLAFAVDACIDCINAIGEVTLDKQEAIELARAQYELLGDEEKELVTNYNVLVAAEKKLNDLISLQEINELIEVASTTDMDAIKDVFDTYQKLTDSQKQLIADKSKKSDLFVAYAIALINAIDDTITVSSGNTINVANSVYEALTAKEKGRVTNYSKLETALSEYSAIAVESSAWKKTFTDTEFEYTNANTGNTSGSNSVSVNNPTILISKFKVTNLSKIVLSYTTTEKGGSAVKVYYSTDKTNWTQFGSECKNSSNGKSIEHTLVAPGKCIDGEVYIKIEGTCTKAEGSAKQVTIDALEIFAYGMISYN